MNSKPETLEDLNISSGNIDFNSDIYISFSYTTKNGTHYVIEWDVE